MTESPSNPNYIICHPDKNELGGIVSVHSICFPDSFSTAMKPKLLLRFYETYYAENPNLFFIAKQDDKIIGFSMGYGYCKENLTKHFVRKNRLRFVFRCFLQLLKFDKRAWRKVFRKRKPKVIYRTDEFDNVNKEKIGDLLSIAVLPDYRKNGVGGL